VTSKAIATVVAVIAMALAGCGDNDHQATKDAPHGPGDSSPALIYNFPDNYPNVASKCVGSGYRAWVITHNKTDSPPVLRPDKNCPGYDGSQHTARQDDVLPAPSQTPR
jgi:hypothetical protein